MHAGPERSADGHAQPEAVSIPIAHAHACADRCGRVQLDAAYAVADAAAVRIAEPRPNRGPESRAEAAADHAAAVDGAQSVRLCCVCESIAAACTCVLCVCESTATACMCVLVGERVCDEAEWRWDVWAGQGGG